MSFSNGRSPRAVLQDIAQRAMIARGFEPEFSAAALAEIGQFRAAAPAGSARDLRQLPWCSIDNDDSRDLDQLSVAETLPSGETRVSVAIADVAELVRKNSAVDEHARKNTTSVYTAARIFPMLPERLSTDLTSLNFGEDRRAIVVAMTFDAAGTMRRSEVFEALVHNQARLAYNAVAAWLEGQADAPPELARVAGLAENLRWQDAVAGRLRASRYERGALAFETIQTRPVFDGGTLRELAPERANRAKKLIEDLMIAANGVVAAFLTSRGMPSVRRMVGAPKNWPRIVTLAAEHGATLPEQPDGRALSEFLERMRAMDPMRFPDLSLSIVKLIGAGEYVVEFPGQPSAGHFGLAVKDYAHSTAPNRRFPDLLTQRLVKAALHGGASPYAREELTELARHCTEQEDDAKKVERQVAKSAAAILLSERIGAEFDGLITGAADKGTWVRIFQPPVEGKLVRGCEGLQVGQRVRVRLLHADIERGFLDFACVGARR